jgi:hypothetical protein
MLGHAYDGPFCAAGRSTERPVLSEEQIERNVQGIRRILEALIRAQDGSRPQPTILNNLVKPTPDPRSKAVTACFHSMQCPGVRRAQDVTPQARPTRRVAAWASELAVMRAA